MDDRTFDSKSALDWIATIESEGAKKRDAYLYPFLNDWIRQVGAVDILDIGAGQGVCASKLDLTARQYTGVEPSAFLLERALELHAAPNRKFIAGNAYELPLENDSFDAVFSIAVWHLLSDLPKAMAELARVLRKGGAFLIVTANPAVPKLWEGFKDDVLFIRSLEELANAAKTAGLRVMQAKPFLEATGLQGPWLAIRGVKLK